MPSLTSLLLVAHIIAGSLAVVLVIYYRRKLKARRPPVALPSEVSPTF